MTDLLICLSLLVSPYYHVLDAQRESICSGCDSNVGYSSINSIGQYGLQHGKDCVENGHAVVRRISTGSVGSIAGRRMLWAEQTEVCCSNCVSLLSSSLALNMWL